MIASCVTFGLLAAALGPMIVLVNSTPDRIPADVIAEERDREQAKQVDTQSVHGDTKV